MFYYQEGFAMNFSFLGLDIAKDSFQAALQLGEKYLSKNFQNKEKGFRELESWLKKNNVLSVHACMEATGKYGIKLATFFYEAGHRISVVNPAQVKGFAQSQLARIKTDKADAILIAQFCKAIEPGLWKPTSPEVSELQGWIQRLDSLQAMKQQESNRIKEAVTSVANMILKNILSLDNQILEVQKIIKKQIKNNPDLKKNHDLLKSIPGVSDKTIANILAYIKPLNFDSAKKLTAFIGLNPREFSSGSSVRGRARISKTGNARLRKSLYMPAVVAMHHNPIIKNFCARLEAKGKPKMLIVIASMRKLLHIIYGVMKSGKNFDPRYIHA